MVINNRVQGGGIIGSLIEVAFDLDLEGGHLVEDT